ncbi:MAG: hypothetical protein RLZZ211_163 [Bacteroidota bacterium]|jgi:hypothetical protein
MWQRVQVFKTITVKNILRILIGLAFVPSIQGQNVYNNEVPIDNTEIVVKNKADYSEHFIQGLNELGYQKIELIDSLLIIDNKDTVLFSRTPKIGESREYTGKKGNLAIAVTIKRINYTTVDYRIEMVEFGKANHTQTGQADISSGFFFGPESNIDEQTGVGYFVTEYTDNRANNCATHIRIGDENELAKIIKYCNGKIKDITLDNFTTLHKK